MCCVLCSVHKGIALPFWRGESIRFMCQSDPLALSKHNEVLISFRLILLSSFGNPPRRNKSFADESPELGDVKNGFSLFVLDPKQSLLAQNHFALFQWEKKCRAAKAANTLFINDFFSLFVCLPIFVHIKTHTHFCLHIVCVCVCVCMCDCSKNVAFARLCWFEFCITTAFMENWLFYMFSKEFSPSFVTLFVWFEYSSFCWLRR